MTKSPPQPSKPSAADHDEALRYGYSDESWARTDARDRSLLRLIQPVRRANYRVNVAIGRLEAWLAERDDEARKMGGTFAMEPDFQRGHVWDGARKVAFVESWLRGTAPVLFRFNSPSIQGMSDADGDLHPYDFVCIDGLQRITTLIEFTHDAFAVFDGSVKVRHVLVGMDVLVSRLAVDTVHDDAGDSLCLRVSVQDICGHERVDVINAVDTAAEDFPYEIAFDEDAGQTDGGVGISPGSGTQSGTA